MCTPFNYTFDKQAVQDLFAQKCEVTVQLLKGPKKNGQKKTQSSDSGSLSPNLNKNMFDRFIFQSKLLFVKLTLFLIYEILGVTAYL